MKVALARSVLALGSVVAALFAVNAWLDTGEAAWDTAALGTIAGMLVASLAAIARGAGMASWRWLALPLVVALLSWVRWMGVAYL